MEWLISIASIVFISVAASDATFETDACSGEGFQAHLKDCQSFVYCFHNGSAFVYSSDIVLTCPPGFAFSKEKGICAPKVEVNSCETTSTGVSTNNLSCTVEGAKILNQSVANCKAYYDCTLVNGVLTNVNTTCLDHMAFSVKHGRCLNVACVTC